MREIRVKTVGQDCAKFARFRKSGGGGASPWDYKVERE